jgi:hypothetical protein
MGEESFPAAWKMLEDTFKVQCFAQRNLNRSKLDTLQLGQDESVSAYIGRAKNLRLQLRMACETD